MTDSLGILKQLVYGRMKYRSIVVTGFDWACPFCDYRKFLKGDERRVATYIWHHFRNVHNLNLPWYPPFAEIGKATEIQP